MEAIYLVIEFNSMDKTAVALTHSFSHLIDNNQMCAFSIK